MEQRLNKRSAKALRSMEGQVAIRSGVEVAHLPWVKGLLEIHDARVIHRRYEIGCAAAPSMHLHDEIHVSATTGEMDEGA
jgi:hypothetical protein